LKDEDASEEVVQDLFIFLWENRTNIDIKSSLRAFLYTSVKNRSLNYIRNHKTRVLHEDSFARDQSQQISQIIDFCEREELQKVVEDCLADLPKQCREIFELSRNENLTYNEIAQKLSISPKTVENQIGIALKKLRISLGPYISCIIMCF
jgi:RNA polymerase sigma-70 factor (ECF subfamily)